LKVIAFPPFNSEVQQNDYSYELLKFMVPHESQIGELVLQSR